MSRELRGHGSIYKQSKLIDGVRVQGSFWWIAYSVRGKQVRESSGSPERSVAGRLLKKRIAQSANGKPMDRARKAEKLTLGDMLDDLSTDYKDKENRSTIDRARAHLVRLLGGEHTKALDITRNRIQEYRQARKQDFLKKIKSAVVMTPEGTLDRERRVVMEPTSNGTINRDLACLERAFANAVENEKLTHDHVPEMPEPLPEAAPRQGFLDRKDFEALRERLPENLRTPVTFLYVTGWRLGAMQSREWGRDCELERDSSGVITGGVIYLRRVDSKNKEPYSLPLEGELLDVMRAADSARDPACPNVFHRNGSPIGSFTKAWRAATIELDYKRQAKKQEPLLVHDLRRSRIRNLIRAGVSQTVAMKISGHKTASVFRRYNITSQDDLAIALIESQKYDAKSAQLPVREPAQVVAISGRRRSA